MKFDLKKVNAATAVLDINDLIGMGGFCADDMRKALDAKAKNARNITTRICSDGGVITEGLAIYTMLKAHKAKVRIEIMGIAASMGSVIAMSGDIIAMAEDAFMMIHNPQGGTRGESGDMRKNADVLDKMRDQIAKIYSARSGQSLAKIKKMMAEETWLTAKEAYALGFCDEVLPAQKMTAQLRQKTRKFKNKPRALRAQPKGQLDMDPDMLAELGLADDATQEEVNEAIKALKDAARGEDDGDDEDEDDEPENADDDEDEDDEDDKPSSRRAVARRGAGRPQASTVRAALRENRRAVGKASTSSTAKTLALLTKTVMGIGKRLDGDERERLIAQNVSKFTPALEKTARTKWSLAMVKDYIAAADDIDNGETFDEDEDTDSDSDTVTTRRAIRGGRSDQTAVTEADKMVAKQLGIDLSDLAAFKKNGNRLPKKESK